VRAFPPNTWRDKTLRALMLTGSLMAVSAAQAAPADYLCPGDKTMQTKMTPREATLLVDGESLHLMRVRDKGDARYVNAKAGLTLTLKGSSAELERKGQETLVCKLQQRALVAKP